MQAHWALRVAVRLVGAQFCRFGKASTFIGFGSYGSDSIGLVVLWYLLDYQLRAPLINWREHVRGLPWARVRVPQCARWTV